MAHLHADAERAIGEMRKVYRVLVRKPFDNGVIQHYMPPGPALNLNTQAPRLVSESPIDGWKDCKCVVLSCTDVTDQLTMSASDRSAPPPSDEWPAFAIDAEWDRTISQNEARMQQRLEGLLQDGASPYYELQVELITGRTHQLRAQFAAMGAPIVGDTMYAPMSGFFVHTLSEKDEQVAPTTTNGPMAAKRLMDTAAEPEIPIGLHAAVLELNGTRIEAGPPWWRGGLY
mmetsp:Transcript_547/g.1559  ORF Transcript_547/g.1559 Transcript_547/m.1559 type:complete len:230 (-) Transcript_547:688-1377(-)